jgi:hypothetical protein
MCRRRPAGRDRAIDAAFLPPPPGDPVDPTLVDPWGASGRSGGRRPARRVVDQPPRPGAELESGSQVMAVVSAGREQMTVPKLVGSKADAAEQLLTAQGLHSSVRLQERLGDVPVDIASRVFKPASSEAASVDVA